LTSFIAPSCNDPSQDNSRKYRLSTIMAAFAASVSARNKDDRLLIVSEGKEKELRRTRR